MKVPLTIGPEVSVGHLVMLHGCTIGEGSLIGIQSVILNHAVIGRDCLISACASRAWVSPTDAGDGNRQVVRTLTDRRSRDRGGSPRTMSRMPAAISNTSPNPGRAFVASKQ
jgi:carbonic anhydrase/acetyltransferase-like protein (isoleucine patch superfamily)